MYYNLKEKLKELTNINNQTIVVIMVIWKFANLILFINCVNCTKLVIALLRQNKIGFIVN